MHITQCITRAIEHFAAGLLQGIGGGIAEDFLREHLFKPFQSTKDGGFGIGAFEAREIARAHGGRLEVESRPGEGSSFTIFLPALPEAGEGQRHRVQPA